RNRLGASRTDLRAGLHDAGIRLRLRDRAHGGAPDHPADVRRRGPRGFGRGPGERLHRRNPDTGPALSVQRESVGAGPPYCPTVKSILFSTVPEASLTSTCQGPVQSGGTLFLLHVRQGDPLTCSSTSQTCVSPWHHTGW